MPPPTALSIGTESVKRLVKEEASYHQELKDQENRIQKLEQEKKSSGAEDEGDDGNREYMMNQERRAVEETKKVFPALKQKISDAVAHLDRLLIEEGHKGAESDVAQINAAKDAISSAKTAVREIA